MEHQNFKKEKGFVVIKHSRSTSNGMKKIAGSLAIGSLFLMSSTAIFAASAGGTFDVPIGGACGATEDCARGLICAGGGVCASGATPAAAPVNTNVTGGDGSQVPRTPLQNPIRFNNFYDFVREVLRVAVEILMPFVVLAFIWSGFLFVRAQGNPAELEKAKSAIYWSVIGAFILMGAWGFAQIIGTTVSTLTQ